MMGKPKQFRLVAVFDGPIKKAEISLWLEYDGDSLEQIPWPDDWPERVTTQFVKDSGFEIVRA